MAANQALITIDGSHGEGGGALLRTAFAMAALTQQAVRIHSVRGGTKFPGLDVEDLTYLKALARICRAETTGAEIASETVGFFPTNRPEGFSGALSGDQHQSAPRGPNACVLLGALLPVLAKSGVYSSLAVEGETFGANSLSYDYFANVTLAALRKTGLYAFPELMTAGFGRESKGQVTLDVEPSALQGVTWSDRGKLKEIRAIVSTASLPASVGDRAVAHLRRLAQNSGLQMQAEHIEVGARGAGVYVTSWAQYERGMGGGTAMGMRGLRSETLAQLAFEEMYEWMAGPSTVDPYLADQLLLPLVMAEGESVFTVSRLTSRFLTCSWVVKQFTPIHITIRGSENGPGSITIKR
ncbi:RNA 3'-terminal phosphate cyclase [Fimbriimonas ginsengisoli]|uniref:RNA 3'-terminal-phosphate cyclase (ATP) n=1 Tax=Fimbriimonas ginsengisoli Gsoil 348 TaxID=661478 RepID=A0A068NRP5_FIMGI|nr:RNA 3'-terminal phosphate cyclase [Fimbriimonas ginsengisoli]AIE84289.1 RNA 3'-phosphate cyclase [Fimbriimonas ginsengisoli Gsoil 348]